MAHNGLIYVKAWREHRRIAVSVLAIVAVAVAGAVYLVTARGDRATGVVPTAAATGDMRFIDLAGGRNDVERVTVADPAGPRAAVGVNCLRYYSSAGTTVCLKVSGVGPTYAAEISGPDGAVVRSVPLPGVPSRARVSASGRIVTWTAFVTGDSYSVPGGFSTRTGFYDMKTGRETDSIEHWVTSVGGQPVTAIDVNYWGLTVAADDRTVYATLATGGKTWLVRGDLDAGTAQAVHPGAECPSLSPDGTHVAYKRRTSRLGPWELAVLDLKTGAELVLPGTQGIDDQAEWLDNNRLAYGAVPRDGRVSGVFFVAADGSAPATLEVPDAASPSVVR